ncbi:ABC transporter ATP-binding protein [Microbacterium sp. STN6]|uniref:dipeptide ABC transporter ATP-binding protein n=1 Tax=Microbacterium sp. STN6 TaxID=2995588 RepID=UPI00226098EE|nr:ABC transporter ATP-binding protein [Microbacterium sp. STN6]MCX7522226.1 ABC transporter ATP-binding protein [Microbacterium sp. STN6]
MSETTSHSAADRASAAAPSPALLTVSGLSVRFGRTAPPVVDDVSFEIRPGECLALVGESGSGKSVTARTLVGLTGGDARVSAESLVFDGAPLLSASAAAWRRIRGARIGFVLQDALVSLDPLRTVGREIDDALRLHTRLGAADRHRRVIDALTDAGVPDPALRAGQRAGQLSGGLRQRALIASAVVLNPSLVIADEPTTALDVGVQQQVLGLLEKLRAGGTGLLLISHDLSLVARVADRVAVMRDGRIVETGATEAVLGDPQQEYTKTLLAAVPWSQARGTRLTVEARAAAETRAVTDRDDAHGSAALEITDVSKAFRTPAGTLQAVRDVSLRLEPGTTLGLVGESGSGKSTTARIALGLLAPDAGQVRLLDQEWAPLPERERRPRRHLLGAVYQDALSSFDPRWSVGGILTDALTGGASRSIRRYEDEVAALLRSVGLNPDLMRRRTHGLSGGQRQRVSIARAIAPGPRVLICDEPVSSLDVSVQAQVLDLLDELQEQRNLSYLFISHDLGVIRHISDRVAVMSEGRIVETGATETVFSDPRHPYTRRLLTAVPHRRDLTPRQS